MTLYRGMREAADGKPKCGATARTLGVRVPDDVAPDEEGRVHPGRGGMSVAPDDPMRLRAHRRPRALGGTGPDPVFSTVADQLGGALAVRLDGRTHALVEPNAPMDLPFYVRSLHSTRPLWTKFA